MSLCVINIFRTTRRIELLVTTQNELNNVERCFIIPHKFSRQEKHLKIVENK